MVKCVLITESVLCVEVCINHRVCVVKCVLITEELLCGEVCINHRGSVVW